MSYAPPMPLPPMNGNGYAPMPPFGAATMQAPDPAGIGPVTPAPPLTVPDPSKVDKKLVSFLTQVLEEGRQQSNDLIQKYTSLEKLYRGADVSIKQPGQGGASAAKLATSIELRDVADQEDALAGLLFEQIFPSSSASFSVSARGSTRPEQAACMYQAMQDMIEVTGSDKEIERCVQFYAKYPVSSLKLERGDVKISKREESEIAPEEYPALQTVCSVLGRTCRIVKQPNPASIQPTMCVETRWSETQVRWFFKNLDGRKLRISDARRDMQDQHAIAEAHYWTRDEMRSFGFDVSRLTQPNSGGRHRPNPNTGEQTNTSAPTTTNPFNTFEVWEIFVRVPWTDWLEGDDGKNPVFSTDDFDAWANQHSVGAANGFTEEDYGPGLYWRAFFVESGVKPPAGGSGTGGAVLMVSPSYRKGNPDKLPAWATSYIPPDGDFAGQAMAERQAGMNAAANLVFNDWLDNIRRQGRTSFFYGGNMSIAAEKAAQIHAPGASVKVNGAMDPRETIFPFPVEDITPQALRALGYIQGDVKDKGINDSMLGQSDAGTATQASIDNSRGQIQINAAFKRWGRRVYAEGLRALAVEIAMSYKVADYIRVCGDDGNAMKSTSYNCADDVMAAFRIEPVATFDFAERRQKLQALTSLANIFARVLPPQSIQAMFKVCMRSIPLPQADIDEIEGSTGSITDFVDEIKGMLADPNYYPMVRPDDNHLAVLQLIRQIAMDFPQTAMQLQTQDNYKLWVMQHTTGAQAQMMQQQASQPPQKRGAQPKPNSPSGSSPEEANARQDAQEQSPPDSGQMTNGGVTGQAAYHAQMAGASA